MSTTTIRLPDELKARIARAAERSGMTSHGFILAAIGEKAEQEDRRANFHDEADRRYAGIVASGKGIPWSEMRCYLEQRSERLPRKRPVAKKLAR